MDRIFDYMDIIQKFVDKRNCGEKLTPKELKQAKLLDCWFINDPNIY